MHSGASSGGSSTAADAPSNQGGGGGGGGTHRGGHGGNGGSGIVIIRYELSQATVNFGGDHLPFKNLSCSIHGKELSMLEVTDSVQLNCSFRSRLTVESEIGQTVPVSYIVSGNSQPLLGLYRREYRLYSRPVWSHIPPPKVALALTNISSQFPATSCPSIGSSVTELYKWHVSVFRRQFGAAPVIGHIQNSTGLLVDSYGCSCFACFVFLLHFAPLRGSRMKAASLKVGLPGFCWLW